MNTKNIIIILLLINILLFGIGLPLLFPEVAGFCKSRSDFDCLSNFEKYRVLGAVMTFLSPLLFLGGIIVLSYHRYYSVFNAWRKFSIVFIPIAMICIFLAPSTARNFLGFEREWVTGLLAIVFFITSIILIIATARRGK